MWTDPCNELQWYGAKDCFGFQFLRASWQLLGLSKPVIRAEVSRRWKRLRLIFFYLYWHLSPDVSSIYLSSTFECVLGLFESVSFASGAFAAKVFVQLLHACRNVYINHCHVCISLVLLPGRSRKKCRDRQGIVTSLSEPALIQRGNLHVWHFEDSRMDRDGSWWI